MNNVPETVLQKSLDLLEQGQSFEQILARYPEHAADLRPFLETAAQLASLASQPSLAAKQKSQKAFLAHAESLKRVPVRPSPWYRLRQILLPIASLAVVLILFATTAVSVSGSAIPGDALYSVKRLVENVRLNQENDPEAAVALAEEYRHERMREVLALLRTGRVADVTFEGELISMQPGEWQVDIIKVMLDEATVIVGEPQLGELARVNGRTGNGALIAATIEMLTGSTAQPDPVQETTSTPRPTVDTSSTVTLEPTSEPTETVDSTATPTTELTKTPTPSPTPTILATPTSTATPKPTMTSTPTMTPTPTQPPADDDDGNSNDDDGNSNDDDDNANNDNGNNNDDDNNANNDNGNDNDDNGNDNDDNGNDNDDNSNDNDDNGNDNDDNSNDNDDDDNGNDNEDDNDNDDDDDDDSNNNND